MRTRTQCLATIAALTLSSAALAQGYVGLGAGPTRLNVDCSDTITCDKTGTGFKLYGGFKFTPNVALEGNYFDFGKAKATVDTGVGVASVNLKTKGYGVGGAFFGEFAPNFTGVARVGVASVKATADAALGSLSGSDSESTTQLYIGLGAGYTVMKGLSIDAGIDFSKSKYAGESGNVHLLSIGASYSF
jgi:OOP family OmpA-OmpF porin